MDPDKALQELREKMREIETILDRVDEDTGYVGGCDREKLQEAANRAVDLWIGLDNWMSKAGFLPADWAKGR